MELDIGALQMLPADEDGTALCFFTCWSTCDVTCKISLTNPK